MGDPITLSQEANDEHLVVVHRSIAPLAPSLSPFVTSKPSRESSGTIRTFAATAVRTLRTPTQG